MTAKEIAQGAFASLSTLPRIAEKAKSQRVSTIWFCICLMSYVEKEDFMREDVHSKEFWDEAQKKAAFQKRFDIGKYRRQRGGPPAPSLHHFLISFNTSPGISNSTAPIYMGATSPSLNPMTTLPFSLI